MATATKKILASAKYPGWQIETEPDPIRRAWTMTHPACPGYAVSVIEFKPGDFGAEILTLQTDRRTGTRGYDVPRVSSQFAGAVSVVIAEIERRTAYWKSVKGGK